MSGYLKDSYGRTIRDLRISLTDRCNLRCFYCRPINEGFHSPKDAVLRFEEIFRISQVFVSLGIEKIRLTGGEPLLRRDAESLIRSLSTLKPRLKDIALTTNGFSLPERARELKKSGLDRVTISLDTLDQVKFKEITGADKLADVFRAIESAKAAGLEPIKINTVVIKGVNENETLDFARFAREFDVSVRFIEFMPLDSGNSWRRDLLVSGGSIAEQINGSYPLVRKQKRAASETASVYRFADGGKGEIGIIASVSQMFCGACSRIRMTADGQLRTCLFSNAEHDLRARLRSGADDAQLAAFIKQAVWQKEAQHRINEPDFVQPKRTMSKIGG